MISDEQAKDLVSANIARLLNATGKTAYWLMKELDVSPGSLYPIVRGEVAPTIGFASRIGEALGVTVEELLKPVTKSRKNSKIPA